MAAQSPPDSTVPDASDATVADGSMMPMPDGVGAARRAWLDFAAGAGSQTFAGGAPARDLVEGNRVIAIGDSLMASTARRYGGELCKAVVPDGWDVEVDAETGRFIDFGERVLDRRLDDDFDAAVVMLGNNYGANPDVFRDGLEQIVDDLAPRPTILYTVTMFEPNRADVNDIIYDIAMAHDNVRVIDWAGETAKDPALLGGDGLHLSDAGRARFAALLADELGRAPGGSGTEGECLSSQFTDDSATSPTGTTLPGQAPAPPADDHRPAEQRWRRWRRLGHHGPRPADHAGASATPGDRRRWWWRWHDGAATTAPATTAPPADDAAGDEPAGDDAAADEPAGHESAAADAHGAARRRRPRRPRRERLICGAVAQIGRRLREVDVPPNRWKIHHPLATHPLQEQQPRHAST